MDDGAPFTSWTEPKWTVLLGFKIPVQRYYYVHTATVTIDRKERQMVQEGKKESVFRRQNALVVCAEQAAGESCATTGHVATKESKRD